MQGIIGLSSPTTTQRDYIYTSSRLNIYPSPRRRANEDDRHANWPSCYQRDIPRVLLPKGLSSHWGSGKRSRQGKEMRQHGSRCSQERRSSQERSCHESGFGRSYNRHDLGDALCRATERLRTHTSCAFVQTIRTLKYARMIVCSQNFALMIGFSLMMARPIAGFGEFSIEEHICSRGWLRLIAPIS
ncbi:hypothetical protein HD806DRAFT_162088 [Xylariaceae sp. AK1471]|nr:hypothetical protein HD806DRAFT_162088 [Xylariaceae sp. AK1471]